MSNNKGNGRRASRSVVVAAVLAIGVLLAGGAAVAGQTDDTVDTRSVPANSVGPGQLKTNAVRSRHLLNGTVTSADIKNDSITTGDIRNGTVNSGDIRNGTISRPDLAPPLRPRWAKVDADSNGAALLRGIGVTAVGRAGVGVYSVTFDTPVANCGWTATLNDNGAGAVAAGQIGIEQGSLTDANMLWVRTWDSNGTPVDRSGSDGFTIQLFC